MSFQVDGKLHRIFSTEQKSEKFRAREFVIEVSDGKFPQMIKFQLTQDKCDAIESFSEGEQITVHFDLRGREWNDKYFTNLNAWRLESPKAGSSEAASAGTSAGAVEPQTNYANTNTSNSFDDDMPF